MKRVASLDGIRGLAVGIVVIVHFTNGLNIGVAKTIPFLILYRFLQSFWLGVDIFFVLSGFLITGIILKERTEPKFLGNVLPAPRGTHSSSFHRDYWHYSAHRLLLVEEQ